MELSWHDYIGTFSSGNGMAISLSLIKKVNGKDRSSVTLVSH